MLRDPGSPRLRNRICRTVTCGAIFRSRLVEENRFGSDYFSHFVAVNTTYSLMRSTQREGRARLMIKERRLPLHAVVAFRATRDLSLGELLSMDVLMTVFTLRGRGLEIYIEKLGFEIRRLMTADTWRGPVCSQQRKTCLGMVKTG